MSVNMAGLFGRLIRLTEVPRVRVEE